MILLKLLKKYVEKVELESNIEGLQEKCPELIKRTIKSINTITEQLKFSKELGKLLIANGRWKIKFKHIFF